MNEGFVLDLTDPSQVAEARRLTIALARARAFGQTEAGKIAIVVTELATNLLKHAQGGELIVQPLQWGGIGGVEILALDRGPGMASVGQCLRDGYSTAGSPGTGLGAVARLSALCEIYSLPGVGTALLSRLWSRPLSRPPLYQGLMVGAVAVPSPGEELSGDAWVVAESPGRVVIVVADGLGHGPLAAAASRQAVAVLPENIGRAPTSLMEAAHAALQGTRGAAVAVTEIDVVRQQVSFVGVGNIAGSIRSAEGARSMLSHNGIVGHDIRKIQEFTYSWTADALLVLHSDGLASRWDLSRYPGLTQRHCSLIAGVLYRDFRRKRDDVTVVVVRRPQAGGSE